MGLSGRLVAVLLSCLLASTAWAEEVHVAVASNFLAPMKDIAAAFEKDSGHSAILSFGSSGKIYAQIRNGAPFQIFLSADQAKPKALEDAGLAVAGSRFTYALGALALLSSQVGSAKDGSAKAGFAEEGHARLKSGDFNKLAMANPKLAPYGNAAMEVLESLGLKQATKAKWVMGENITQTYQFVATGNAELGFVALSQIMDKGQVNEASSWIIPDELYNPIRQDAILLKSASDNPGAKALLEYLRSEEARTIIRSYGYKTE